MYACRCLLMTSMYSGRRSVVKTEMFSDLAKMFSGDAFPSSNWDAFLNHLALVMERADLNQAGLAAALQCERSTVSNWFKGVNRFGRQRFLAIVEVLQRYRKDVFSGPLEVVDWAELGGWQLSQEELHSLFPLWFREHKTLPRGPVLSDQRYLLRPRRCLIGRQEEMARLQEWLTSAEGFRQPAVKVVVIGGMAGVGKTTLAQAIGENPLIEAYFRDGVLWARLGPQPNVEQWLQEWAHLLGWDPRGPEMAGRYLARFLADEERRALLILDDVWPGTPFEPLINLAGPQTRVLLTSRALTIGTVYERNQWLRLELPTHEEAVAMAREMLGEQPQGIEPEKVEGLLRELAEAVGRLPVAIRVATAAAQIDGLEKILLQLRPGEVRFTPQPERIRRLEVAGAEPRETAVQIAFEASYQGLEEEDRRRFRLLGNLPRGATFGEEVLAALWGEGVESARQSARRLAERSLLERMRESRYSLHDLLHDFAAGIAERMGERDTEGRWAEEAAKRLIGKVQWWKASVPRVWAGPKPFTRAWWAEGWRDFSGLRREFRELIQERWQREGITAEAWAVGMTLNRRIDRVMHRFWGFMIWMGFLILLGIGLLQAKSWGLINGTSWPRWVVTLLESVFYGSALVLASILWAATTAVIDLYRLYHLPPGALEGTWKSKLRPSASLEKQP